jgi:hypothetical protein
MEIINGEVLDMEEELLDGKSARYHRVSWTEQVYAFLRRTVIEVLRELA